MIVLRLGFCLGVLVLCLYSYQNKQNDLTHIRILIPQLEKEISTVREETRKLQYEVDRTETPTRLIELAHSAEYRHLKHPLLREIKEVPEAIATNY